MVPCLQNSWVKLHVLILVHNKFGDHLILIDFVNLNEAAWRVQIIEPINVFLGR